MSIPNWNIIIILTLLLNYRSFILFDINSVIIIMRNITFPRDSVTNPCEYFLLVVIHYAIDMVDSAIWMEYETICLS